MTHLSAADMDKIAARHPEIFRRSLLQRYKVPITVSVLALYFAFSWWFFAVGKVISTANWSIAGNYLADWVSYEIRPEINIAGDGAISIAYSRFDPIGPNPNPNWLVTQKAMMTRTTGAADAPAAAAPAPKPSSFNFMGAATQQAPVEVAAPTTRQEEVITKADVRLGAHSSLLVDPASVELTRGAESVTLMLDRKAGTVLADGPLPTWVEQRERGGRVMAYFGFDGWVDISADRVRVRNRFFGWANFFFDTNSAFFGKSTGEVISLVTSGARLDPAQSNLSLAWNDILYNPSWQHLDVWTKLAQTLVMAFVGTVFASLVAFPLSFIAARNITRNRPVNQITKRFFDFLRSVDMLIWALFFTRAFGPGPLAGISAIFFTDTGTFGKLYSEALENIDDKQREGVKSVGASPLAVQRFGILPQVLPVFASQALYFWESNTRSATIIGAVGAGGIGLKLWEAMRTNQNWENVCYMVLLILLVVFVFDAISNLLRSKLIGAQR
ncbi:phosphonate ABC transporter, permease protein PhnE [Allorhizobium taibaishanense]|uniref:Phosphonate ABC transporter, permease protein PhnE n=1 Tax=Allorhizobium taibaishanense TaxID=887144 RepID=A0A1Q9A8E9_9HYPH|nr:phosphonate ABC transporter, permease protein PhnE [Allorhizobium taibaishanense]MBB4009610.1 phosphonate transport system permease protein [Allorhizobium taibaishanense]OLP50868.1 phosphonate ABC transporter, permease protein PhnE [Allorhizobium taibaishanense]